MPQGFIGFVGGSGFDAVGAPGEGTSALLSRKILVGEQESPILGTLCRFKIIPTIWFY